MKRCLIALVVAAPAFAQEPVATQATSPAPAAPAVAAPAPRVYIPVGDPTLKKALLAIEPTKGGTLHANELYETLTNDMDYTDLFEMLPPSKVPSPKTGANVDFEAYRALGVEFMIRSSYSLEGGKPQAELRLFDIAKGTQIVGRLYPLVSPSTQPARELAHYAGNDIIQALTGEPGIFRTRLLMSCGARTKEIYIMDFDGQNIRQLTKDRNFALSPSWGPDGKRILFTSYKPAIKGGSLNPNLYSYDMSTNQRRLVSAARGLNTGGVFHPRENKVAYTFSVNGKPEIYVHDLNSNTRRPITRTQFFSVEPSWSPDGQKLTYSSSQTGRPHIYVSNADGSNSQRLTFAGIYNSSPNWSPRGDKIVFAGQDNKVNNFNIFMIDPAGTNLVRLTDGSRSNENPGFSPDGRHVVYSSDQDGQYRIYVMTARGTKIRVLTPKNLGPCKQPSWSPRL